MSAKSSEGVRQVPDASAAEALALVGEPDRQQAYAGVLAEVLGVGDIDVDGHFFDDLGADSLKMAHFCARVRKSPALPSVSMRDVYRHTTIRRLTAAVADPVPDGVAARATSAAASSQPEPQQGFAEVLAEVLGVGDIDVDGHFFDDLGADSLKMAHFCARVRKSPALPSVSMRDVYRHTTIRHLAAAVADPMPRLVAAPAGPVGPVGPVDATTVQSAVGTQTPTRTHTQTRADGPQYFWCGALQLLIFLGYVYLAALVVGQGYEWISAGTDELDIYVRSVLSGSLALVFLLTLPVISKWILVGRWKATEIPIWSLAYVRFWLVRTLVQRNLLVFLFAGSPLYSFYLRALGAKVGPGVTIFTLNVPACTDLLTIGAGTVIRKDSVLNCYRAHAGMIQTGEVTIGRDAYVGEVTVLDIDTSVGDRAQLGHSSSLHPGQAVPDGQHWHGSPAQPTDVDYQMVAPRPCGTVRRAAYAVFQVLTLLTVSLPLAIGGFSLLLFEVPALEALLDPGTVQLTSWAFYGHAAEASFLLFFGSMIVGLVVVATVPRLLDLGLRADHDYPLFGVHYSLLRTVTRMTNLKIFTFLFGDSSYIVGYLRWVGYELMNVRQTGSNFGQAVKHESPYLSSVGSGTVVADGLSIINADFSSTSFRLSRASIGAENFLGNRIAYPSQGRTGANCLLATKVMVPIDGEIRTSVGLLGSPPFEIPRTVDRDSGFDVGSPDELRRRLRAKNRHNLATMGLYLLVRWVLVFLITLVGTAAMGLYATIGASAIALANVLIVAVGFCYFIVVERAVGRLQVLKPDGCSIYDPEFWRHERYWKLSSVAVVMAFNGTPFKSMVWRLMGASIGRRVFDDGCMLTERRFATIGDHCTLNAGTTVQSHSQEDGAFKSDHIVIGSGCTLGVSAFAHYGVSIGDGAELAADSFLMKGEDMPARAEWGGNPAREMSARAAAPPVVRPAEARRVSMVGSR